MTRRWIAPAVLLALFIAAWLLGLGDQLSWSGLARKQAWLTRQAGAYPVTAASLYFVIYVVSVTLSLPQAALLTMTGGLLFGTVAGGALAVTGATVGAAFLFLIARSAFGDMVTRRGGPAMTRIAEALKRDGFAYLLSIRLIPVVPFWLVNLAAALCGMRLIHFFVATFLGIIPATFIMASIGAGLGEVLARGARPDLSVLVSAPVLGPLLALALLSLTPVLTRRWRAGRG